MTTINTQTIPIIVQLSDGTQPGGTGFNITQQGGVAISLNTGVRDAGTQRVTIATNDVVLVDQVGASTATAPAQTGVGTTALQILADNASRRSVTVQNTGTTVVKLALGSTVPTATTYHVALRAGVLADDGQGGIYTSDIWTGALQAISTAGGTVVITELTA